MCLIFEWSFLGQVAQTACAELTLFTNNPKEQIGPNKKASRCESRCGPQFITNKIQIQTLNFAN